jgi:FixJ family two-component response regulator
MDIHDKLEPMVLIVNSDEAARTWIEATVLSAGLHAESFHTAAELVTRFEQESAACVILDIVLSDASGLELQEQLTRAGASVIFLTRERCISSCVKALKAGAIDFLTMPCDAMDLVRAARAAARQAASLWSQRIQFGTLRSKYEKLTPREREVFVLVSSGLLNKQIAQRLDISEITVQIHRGRVMRKMAAASFASLVRMADALQPLRPEHWAH